MPKPRYQFANGVGDKVQESTINNLAADGYKAILMTNNERGAINNQTIVVFMELEED